MQYIGSDIQSQNAYFRSLQEGDPELKSFLFEAGEGTDILADVGRNPDLSYPCAVLFMPFVDLSDDETGNIEAEQENSLACLFLPAEATSAARDQALVAAQQAAFRMIREMRKTARTGALRLVTPRKWKLRPMTHVGPDNAVGYLIDFTIVTNANALVGSSD